MSETVRLQLSVAATEDMEVASLDVNTAFSIWPHPTHTIHLHAPASRPNRRGYTRCYTFMEVHIRTAARVGSLPKAQRRHFT